MTVALPLRQVLVGDMRTALDALPDDSIDAGTTDPPYEIKIGGNAWDRTGVAFDVAAWRAYYRVLKPGAHLAAFGGTTKHHRVWCAIEDAGFEIRDTILWIHAQGMSHTSELSKLEDEALAAQWTGWSARLRANVEPICLARKPLVGTLAENLARYGTGALHVDACRVPIPPGDRPSDAGPEGRYLAGAQRQGHIDGMQQGRVYTPHSEGRWPSNVVLSHTEQCPTDGPCVLGCPVAELDAQSGIQRDGVAVRHRGSNFDPSGPWGSLGVKPVGTPDMTYGGSGGASRYYPVFRYIAKPSPNERKLGLARRNPHHTVKPLALMRWLVRLVTPPQGVVLDAFAGSGTTLMGAELEDLRWIGVELDADNAEVARRRAFAAAELAGRVDKTAAEQSERAVQIGLFGG